LDKEKLYVFGRSLGGAVATQLCMDAPEIRGMILENTFTSIGDMVDKLMPLVAIFKSIVQKVFFPTIDRIHKIKQPILFIRGMKDEIVPCDHT